MHIASLSLAYNKVDRVHLKGHSADSFDWMIYWLLTEL